jgi:peptide/nickel transport system permease protein
VGHAYGIAPSRLIYKYALKNALMPVITFVGLQIGFLIGGVVLVEVVFALPGIGRYAVDSLLVNDFAPVQGFVLVVLTVYLCINLLADVLYRLSILRCTPPCMVFERGANMTDITRRIDLTMT